LCKAGTGGTETGTIVTTAHYSDGSSMVVTPNSYVIGNTNIVASVSAAGLVKSGSTTGSTTVTVTYEGKTAIVTVNVTDCTPPAPCVSADLLNIEFKVKLPSNGSSWENWTEYLAGKFSPTTYNYDITTFHNGGPKYGFRVTAECEDNTKIWFNWYRGDQCGATWLSGNENTWIPITSGGIYPAGNYENSLCNQGGNILKIRVINDNGASKIYTVNINRTK